MEKHNRFTIYQKVEFVAFLIIFLFFLFVAFLAGQSDYRALIILHRTTGRGVLGNILPYCLMMVSAYTSFLFLNYFVIPRYFLKNRFIPAVGLTLATLISLGLLFMVSYSYIRYWTYDQHSLAEANMFLFSRGMSVAAFVVGIFAFYVLLRELAYYQRKRADLKQDLSTRITREVILVVSLWFGGMLPILLLHDIGGYGFVLGFYFFLLPYAFIIYFLNLYWLIPAYKNGRVNNGLYYFGVLLIICFLFGIIEVSFLAQTRILPFWGYVVLYWALPTPMIAGLSWWVYLNNESVYKQLKNLRTALGASDANLQYLRAQINPHFLFNALNTLYGTALVEKADKTGEGIQKLGDMMRFMLHENNMDRIALSRELDYIHNYIDLQNMRLALSPDITVDIQIEDINGYYEIAPMLLIPFIENAYKHGISHQNRSWINVNLYKRDNILHLDVHNSMHPHNDNDPERDQSGTGLDNVKQRLQLSYPGKHELVVRENGKEFFIHLSIQLTTIQTL